MIQSYTVKDKQTLHGIALQLYGNVDAISEILELNDLTGKMDTGVVTTDNVDITLNITPGTILFYDDESPLRRAAVLTGLRGRIFVDELPRIYLAETILYEEALAAAGYTMPVFEKNAFDDAIYSLKEAGLWTKIKALWPMHGGLAATVVLNLKDPRDLDAAYRLTLVNSPTVDSAGISWNGVDQYANTHFIPSTSGLTDMFVSFYALTLSAFQNRVQVGGRTTSTPYVELWINGGASGNISFLGIAGATGADVITPSKPTSDNRGLYVGSRQGTALRLHRNGTQYGSGTPTFAALSGITTKMALCVRFSNNSPVAGTYNTMKSGMAAIGAGLTADEAVTFSEIVNELATALSKNTY